jgi:hypothetical protein
VDSDGSRDPIDRAAALARRFSSRVAPERRDLLEETARLLADAHPEESIAQLAGRLAAHLPAEAAAGEVELSAEPPLLRLDRRLRDLATLQPLWPRELFDGQLSPRAPRELDSRTILAWWRDCLADRAQGRAPALLQLYVHLPYCRTRCHFCQCDSLPLRHPAEIDALLQELLGEAGDFSRELGTLEVQAATIGGGTPSLLDEDPLRRILDGLVGRVFRPSPQGYFSVEMNPDSATAGKLSALASAGVNRVSFGVQSLNSATLRAVNRGYQTAEHVEAAFAMAHRLPSLQLALDLIAPLPEETEESFRSGVRRAIALAPHEVVLYSYQPVVRGKALVEPGSLPWSVARAILLEEAARSGYEPVEQGGPSCVVRRRGARHFAHRYHQHSLEPSSLLGFGPFAQSHVFGRGVYRRLGPGAGPRPYFGGEISLDAEASSFVRRRFVEGAPLEDAPFRDAFGADLSSRWASELAFLEERGALLRLGANRFRPRLRAEGSVFQASWLFLDPGTAGELRRRHLAASAPHAVEDEHESWRACFDPARISSLAAALRVESGAPVRLRGADLIVPATPSNKGDDPARFDLRLSADLVLEEALPGDEDRRLAGRLLRHAEQLRRQPASPQDERMAALAARLLAAGQARSLRLTAASRASGDRDLELSLALAPGSSRSALGALLRAAAAGGSCVPSIAAWDLAEEVTISMGTDPAPTVRLCWRVDPRRSSHLRHLALRHRALAVALSRAGHIQLQSTVGAAAPRKLLFRRLAGAPAQEILRALARAAPARPAGAGGPPRTRWLLPCPPGVVALVAAELPCPDGEIEPSTAELRFAGHRSQSIGALPCRSRLEPRITREFGGSNGDP